MEQLSSTELKDRLEGFNKSVHDTIGDHKKAVIRGEDLNKDDVYYDAFFDRRAEVEGITYLWDDDLAEIPLKEQDDYTMKDLDKCIGTQVLLPNRESVEVLCKVKGQKRDSNDTLIGVYNANPILDTRIFQVEHPNGRVKEYATNLIAESLLSDVDEERFHVGWIDKGG